MATFPWHTSFQWLNIEGDLKGRNSLLNGPDISVFRPDKRDHFIK